MNKVVFPGLNLNFEFSPIAFSVGNLQVYWYGVIIVFAIALSLILMYFTKKKYNINYEDFLEIAIFVLVLGVIGARLFYVLFNLDYYKNNLIQILNIRNGGLAIFGGIIIGAITAFILCHKKKIDFLNFCDYVVPYVALSQGIGRLGNFFNVEAYGIQTDSVFRIGIQSLEGYVEVHPCFLYEMMACIILFVILKILQNKQSYKGEILSFYFIFYGIIRFFVETVRADSLLFLGFKISKLISLIMIIIGAGTYINKIICRIKSTEN